MYLYWVWVMALFYVGVLNYLVLHIYIIEYYGQFILLRLPPNNWSGGGTIYTVSQI